MYFDVLKDKSVNNKAKWGNMHGILNNSNQWWVYQGKGEENPTEDNGESIVNCICHERDTRFKWGKQLQFIHRSCCIQQQHTSPPLKKLLGTLVKVSLAPLTHPWHHIQYMGSIILSSPPPAVMCRKEAFQCETSL